MSITPMQLEEMSRTPLHPEERDNSDPVSSHVSKSRGLQETNFTPLTISDFLDINQEEEAIEWVFDEYLPAGGLALLVGKPKEGKTTLTYELAVNVAKGTPFLNRSTSGGRKKISPISAI